jgi:hypothetical protein
VTTIGSGDRCNRKEASDMVITITEVERIEATARHTVEGGLA